MSFTSRLLQLAAKVALDRLVGQDRTDEAIAIFQEWASERDPAALNQDLEAARCEAANPAILDKVVSEAVKQRGESIGREQRETVALSLASGFSTLPERAGGPPTAKELAEELLPPNWRRKTFVVWLDDPRIIETPPGRYCHFNWDDGSYRVRDFLGHRILHPAGLQVNGQGLIAVPLEMSALDVWNASKGPIQCLDRFGLGHLTVEDADRWREVLELLTESARLWNCAR
jgi:hypothetical protein